MVQTQNESECLSLVGGARRLDSPWLAAYSLRNSDLSHWSVFYLSRYIRWTHPPRIPLNAATCRRNHREKAHSQGSKGDWHEGC